MALLDLVRRRWALRVPSCPLRFHRDGERIRDFRDAREGATAAVGLAGTLFHDLRRSGARNYRKAGVPESVVQSLGGWRTRSMFTRHAIVDVQDLADAADALSTFMENAPAPGRSHRCGAGRRHERRDGRRHAGALRDL